MLIAGLLSEHGAPRELLARWLQGDFELVVSPALLAELERVLQRPKFRKYVSLPEVDDYVALIRSLAAMSPDPPLIVGATPDPGDDYLVSLARATGVGTLVSGDRHLYELVDPVPPVRLPRAFLDRLKR